MKPVMVFLDANIWIGERLLRSAMGAALLYYMRLQDVLIGLPEVTEAEAVARIVDAGEDATRIIESKYVTVQTIMGIRPQLTLPTRDDFEKAAKDRLAEIADFLVRIPLSENHARSTLNRVIAELPPNTTNKEEFRDSLFWEAVLQMSPTYDLHVITNDKDFYEGRQINKGLAIQLEQEVQARGGTIALYDGLDTYLSSEKTPLPAQETLAKAIDAALQQEMVAYARAKDFLWGYLSQYQIAGFLTEQTDTLALTFTLKYQIFDVHSAKDEVLPEAECRVKGDCAYDVTSASISDIHFDTIKCLDPTGKQIPGLSTVYLRAKPLVVGRGLAPYTLRKPLPSREDT